MLQLTTIFFFIASSVLAVTHIIALTFYLYWQFPWFDVPMHVLGGAAVALGVLTLYDFRVPIPKRWAKLLPVLSFVLIVALVWEYYEIFIGIPVEADHLIDTIFDLIAGVVGGVVGHSVGSRIQKLR